MTRFRSTPRQYRVRCLRQYCNIESGVGLEFGPLTNPVVAKCEGRVYYADHQSTEGLINKYAKDVRVDEAMICPVDVVIDSELSVLGSYPKFDYIIASHVFEHFPNPIGWLRGIANYLRPGAVLALAIPDKRYTFDILRKRTELSEVIASDLMDLRKPAPAQVFDHFFNVAHVDTKKAWSWKFNSARVERKYTFLQALEAASRAIHEYIDCHCTVWTAQSFCEIWMTLHDEGVVQDYGLHKVFYPVRFGNDFVVVIKRQ